MVDARCSSSLYSRSLFLPLPERERGRRSCSVLPTYGIEPILVSYGFRRHGWLLQGHAPHLDDRRRLARRSLWRRRRLALPDLLLFVAGAGGGRGGSGAWDGRAGALRCRRRLRLRHHRQPPRRRQGQRPGLNRSLRSTGVPCACAFRWLTRFGCLDGCRRGCRRRRRGCFTTTLPRWRRSGLTR
jgi:hypothetical protein